MKHSNEHGSQRPIDRRRFLAGLGGTAASAVAIPGFASASSNRSSPSTASAVEEIAIDLDLDEIQGNILAGFDTHHQALVFVEFADAGDARSWIAAVAKAVASVRDVMAARATSSSSASRRAVWTNVAVSHTGLAALDRPRAELRRFPLEFRAGMRGRATRIGDVGSNAANNWPKPLQQQFHAVVVVAADRPDDLLAEVAVQRGLAEQHGVAVRHVEFGAARADEPGHEHFGFRDGVSQPGIRGFTEPGNPADEEQGIPGQDLLWPGEFVIGYPAQAGPGGGDDQGRVARSGPEWTVNGSYLVFRRLTQDVAGFRSMVRSIAAAQGLSEDLLGAKLVGRFKSGAPLMLTGDQDTDPGASDPSLLGDDRVNDFEFGDDLAGDVVPLAAHIRKTYPRDHPTDDGGEEDTQRHRLLRRGIAFGASLAANASDDSDAAQAAFPNDRGLLFLCYQTSIARQFEHVQQRWVNDPSFPEPDSGQDPVIATGPIDGEFALPGSRSGHVAQMQRFVTTTGGEYFFQPSRSALALLAQEPTAADATTAGAPEPQRSRDGRPDRRPPRPSRPPQIRDSGRRRGP